MCIVSRTKAIGSADVFEEPLKALDNGDIAHTAVTAIDYLFRHHGDIAHAAVFVVTLAVNIAALLVRSVAAGRARECKFTQSQKLTCLTSRCFVGAVRILLWVTCLMQLLLSYIYGAVFLVSFMAFGACQGGQAFLDSLKNFLTDMHQSSNANSIALGRGRQEALNFLQTLIIETIFDATRSLLPLIIGQVDQWTSAGDLPKYCDGLQNLGISGAIFFIGCVISVISQIGMLSGLPCSNNSIAQKATSEKCFCRI
jgi:hypothetical protein